MPNTGIARRFGCNLNRNKIDIAKLSRLRRTWMWSSDQVHKSISWRNLICVGIHLQGVAGDTKRAWRQFVFRSLSHQCLQSMAALCQQRNQPAADVTRAAGNETINI